MIETEYRKDVRYCIQMVGLLCDCVGYIGSVTIDNKYALIQGHPDCHSICITPGIDKNHPTFEDIVFYTNCLAYEHDLPVFFLQEKQKALVQPIVKVSSEFTRNNYFDSLGIACQAIYDIRFGSAIGGVFFRWPGFEKDVDLPYTKKYSGVAKELSLYSAAIRQLDPLSEFLDYYRIIESVSGDNGKKWISKNLRRIKSYEFGFLEFTNGEYRFGKNQRIRNLFSIYRIRTLTRLRALKKKLKGKSVAEYFYHENRCGIAHGKWNVKTYDFKYNIEEISKDVYILKLLSRIGIEDKVQSKIAGSGV